MIARIQQAFSNVAVQAMDQTIEIDETYVGGKNKNRHYNKRKKGPGIRGRGAIDKIKVFGMLERESGNVRSMSVPSVGKEDLLPIIRRHAMPGATICSDEYPVYDSLSWHNSGYRHLRVDHSSYRYADGDNHTNTIEGYWAIGIKRMIMGVHYRLSPKHIDRYLSGADFRYNTRFMTSGERFRYTLSNTEGRLKYKSLIAAKAA
jgi:transposase-like protein